MFGITLGIFLVHILIWFVSDDALEEWCSLCALGSKRHSADAYKDAKKQSAALEAALVKVGV